MSADKRALDELDALFRAVPAKPVSASRPAKKPRSGEARVASLSGGQRREPGTAKRDKRSSSGSGGSSSSNAVAAAGFQQEDRAVYTRLPAALLPKGFRGGGGGGGGGEGGGGAAYTPRGNTNSSVGAAAAIRLTELVKGMMGVTTEDRAADATIESRLERKVVHLDNVPAVWQTEAQRAGARAGAGRAAGNPARCGLSGKRCKEMGLNALETRGGGSLPFRDLLGLHGVWKYYAARLVSRCGRNQKLLQQRILSADLQGCYLTVCRASASSLVGVAGIVVRETSKTFQLVTPQGKTKTVPKRSCAVRLVLGGRVVNLNGRALESRFAGAGGKQQAGRNRNSAAPGAGVGADDSPADLPLPTAAL